MWHRSAARLPDHPEIRAAERFGVPNEAVPVCPACGEQADVFYLTAFGDILGCDGCIERRDAWDVLAEWEED